MDDEMLTAKECANLLGISVQSYYYISNRVAGCEGGRRSRKWPRSAVEEFRDWCRVEARVIERLEVRGEHRKGRLLPEHDALLSLGRVTENKAKFPYSGPAIYFLFCGDELVYIGQTVNLLNRVSSHFGRKDFDHFSYIVCARDDLNSLERSAIWKYQPKLNKH